MTSLDGYLSIIQNGSFSVTAIRIESTPAASPSTDLGYSPEQIDSLSDFIVKLNDIVPSWMGQAECSHLDQTLFFGEEVEDASKHAPSHTKHLNVIAQNVCGRCPVREQCLDYALTNDLEFGIWGGMTPRARSRYLERTKARRYAS